MKIFGHLIKIVLIATMVTGACFASGAGYNLGDQVNDSMDVIAGIGFTNSTKLTFSKEAVDIILDPRFNPSEGIDSKTRQVKTFLLGTVQGALSPFMPGEPEEAERVAFLEKFHAALAKTDGIIEVDITSIGYNESMYPTRAQTNNAGRAFYNAVEFKLSLVDETGLPLFGHGASSMPRVTLTSAAVLVPRDELEILKRTYAEAEALKKAYEEHRNAIKVTQASVTTKQTYSDDEGMGLFGDD